MHAEQIKDLKEAFKQRFFANTGGVPAFVRLTLFYHFSPDNTTPIFRSLYFNKILKKLSVEKKGVSCYNQKIAMSHRVLRLER